MAGIYIHIPFCASKCVYCGFYSIASIRQKSDFLHALIDEIQLRKSYLNTETIHTIYFGGGTPSLLSTSEIVTILNALHSTFPLDQVREITLEANPEQLTPEYCRALRALGIQRLSIGIQSFQDPVLQFMGRRHNANEAIAAVRNAAEAGSQTLSIALT
ncbi:MAG: radical SAM protein, partial [Bacteroidales bacterium]|nr:radical SAM protein [Bacteroidales bacterium]